MHVDRPPRRTVAVLAGLSCLFLPLLAHVPKATAATADRAPGAGSPAATATAVGPGAMAAAPYEYLGWGNPQKPADVMAATGVKWFTLAFVLSDGTCNPKWDGDRALTGGSDQAAIDSIRAAGGDI
ncbi:hypothetical protein ACIOG9_21240, partial [Streptomyces sp. NPDC088178]